MTSKAVLDAEDYIRNNPASEASAIMDALLDELAEYEALAEPPVLDDIELSLEPDIGDEPWYEPDFPEEDYEASDEGSIH